MRFFQMFALVYWITFGTFCAIRTRESWKKNCFNKYLSEDPVTTNHLKVNEKHLEIN